MSGSDSAINVHIRTPDSSFAARSCLIVSLTTLGARRPYQARHARAYIEAASRSVTRVINASAILRQAYDRSLLCPLAYFPIDPSVVL